MTRCLVDELASARPVWLTTPSTRLYALTAGKGSRGVLLVHGNGPSGVCVWPKEIPALAKAGYQVLAFDHSCVGHSGCPGQQRRFEDVAAGVQYLRDKGASTVVVVGGSAGSNAAVVAAGSPDLDIDAAVALSPADVDAVIRDGSPATAPEAAPKVRVPLLYTIADDDEVSMVSDTEELYDATPPQFRSLIHRATGGHAQEMLYKGDDLGGPVYKRFLDFLREHS